MTWDNNKTEHDIHSSNNSSSWLNTPEYTAWNQNHTNAVDWSSINSVKNTIPIYSISNKKTAAELSKAIIKNKICNTTLKISILLFPIILIISLFVPKNITDTNWFIVIVCFLLGFAFIGAIGCTIAIFYLHPKALSIFKEKMVKAELNEHINIEKHITETTYLNSINSIKEAYNSINAKFEQLDDKDIDFMTAPIDFEFVYKLDISGGIKWNDGVIDNEITGKYYDKSFRFFNPKLTLTSIFGNKQTSTSTVFNGLTFILKLKNSLPFSVRYLFRKGNPFPIQIDDPIKMQSKFRESFILDIYTKPIINKKNAEEVNQPAEQNPVIDETDKNELFGILETQSFVEALMKISQIVPNESWQIRLQDDFLILNIPRTNNLNPCEKGIFEFNAAGYKETIKDFEDEMHEFLGILHALVSINYVAAE